MRLAADIEAEVDQLEAGLELDRHIGRYVCNSDDAPPYSTDLVLAFDVAQEIARRLFQLMRGDDGYIDDMDVQAMSLYQMSSTRKKGAWVAAFMDPHDLPDELEAVNLKGLRAVGVGDTPALAICRAALKVFCLPTQRREP